MTFNEFKITDPGAGEIELFISGGSNVWGITVSKYNCSGTDFRYTLQQAKSITIEDTELTISGITDYSDHFFYSISPASFNIEADNIGTGECTSVILTPFIEPIPFTYNNYNAILGNTLGKITDSSGNLINHEGTRTTSFIFDVDRTDDQIVPLNIENILSGTGTPARFAESNHTDTGLANARYKGTKTSTSDYGTLPAFSAISFKGSTYGADTTDQLICSQSVDNRVIKDLLYSPDSQATVSFENLEEVPQIRYRSLGTPAPASSSEPGGTPASGIVNSESYTVITYNTYLDINVNDIIRIGGTSGEVMKVVGITTQSTSQTTFTVIRAYKKDLNSSNTAATVSSTATKFEIVIGDTIYNAESNQVYRIKDRKLWVQETLQVFYADDTGNYYLN